MTRINTGIHPSELPDKLLLAEHREIKRIPNCIAKGRFSLAGIPEEFTLGKGHVKFFYDKLGYLAKRYESLFDECKARGFNATFFGDAFADCEDTNPELFGEYDETPRDREILLARIKERGFDLIQTGKKPK